VNDDDSNRFSNQLVIYSSHKPRFPRQGRLDHQWHHSGKRHGITIMDRTTQRPPDSQDAPWAHSSRPRRTPFSTSLPIRVYPGPNSVTSFAVERYVIRSAKCETCVQHDKRDEQRSVLNWHRRKINSTPEPCLVAQYLFRPVSNYPSTLGYFQDIIHSIAKISQ
jgi:hypothetical protein